MRECEFINGCPFFNDKMPGTTALLKQQFCRNNVDGCARYMVRMAIGKEKVPSDLLPASERGCREAHQEATSENGVDRPLHQRCSIVRTTVPEDEGILGSERYQVESGLTPVAVADLPRWTAETVCVICCMPVEDWR